MQEIEGNHAEFQRSTTTEENHGIALGNLQQLLDESDSLIHNGLKIFSTMADLHQRETGAVEV